MSKKAISPPDECRESKHHGYLKKAGLSNLFTRRVITRRIARTFAKWRPVRNRWQRRQAKLALTIMIYEEILKDINRKGE